MSFRPDLSILLNAAFGLALPKGAFTIGQNQASEFGNPFQSNGENEQLTSSRKSQYGHDILFPFKFKGNKYKRYDNAGKLIEFDLPDFDLPAATLVSFSRSKNIVKTDVVSGDSTVKELIGFGDWKIRIRGICLNDKSHPQGATAQRQKEVLLQWEQVAGHVEIASGDLFTEKGIHALVINDFNIDQIEGMPDMIPFEMNCDSDVHPDIFLL
jgi:hypothetical protein